MLVYYMIGAVWECLCSLSHRSCRLTYLA